MAWYEIEIHFAKEWHRYVVKAKTYEEACGKVAKYTGDGTFRLLAVFDHMETDKTILKRYA